MRLTEIGNDVNVYNECENERIIGQMLQKIDELVREANYLNNRTERIEESLGEIRDRGTVCE
jgi:hypothetical protein